MQTIRAKVIFNLQTEKPVLHYTDYKDMEKTERFNAYWGCVQAFQSGSHAGETKKYKNVDGLLKIESSTWKNPNIEQTRETRKNPDNWDESKKIFIAPEIKLNKVKFLNENERIDKYSDNVVMVVFNNERYVVHPGQCIEFGNVDEPKVKIY